jgi:uncharacterized protein (TIGR02145 family)
MRSSGLTIFLTLILISNCIGQDTLVDIDGNIYPTIKIGDQIWMIKNLETTHYRSGDSIVSYCYNHDSANSSKYGRLYPWRSIVGGVNSDSLLGICPENWHVPTDKEWDILIDTLGGMVSAGVKLRRSKSTNFRFQWGGNYQNELDIFSFVDRKVYLWSSTTYSNKSAWMRMTGISTKNINRSTVPKEFAFSIRCVKN